MQIYSAAVFILAAFTGYFTVWNVPQSLHSPLMSVSNAVSGVIILGAIHITGNTEDIKVLCFGLAAIYLAAVNIAGGFVVSDRMLALFKKRKKR